MDWDNVDHGIVAKRHKGAIGITLAESLTQRDCGYYPSPGAHIYTTARSFGKTTTRFYVSILISPTYRPFDLGVRGQRHSCGAAVLGPLIPSAKGLNQGSLVTIHLEPTHAQFRRFSSPGPRGILQLDRSLFAPFDDKLQAACTGRLSLDHAKRLIEQVVARTAPHLPEPPPSDPRVLKVCELARREPRISLSDIANALQLSYDRTSHIFTEAMGLPFRSYQLWIKVRRANRLLWSGKSLTEAAHDAGFADSAHLCRTYQKVFGHPPSYYFDKQQVRIFAPKPSIGQHADNAHLFSRIEGHGRPVCSR